MKMRHAGGSSPSSGGSLYEMVLGPPPTPPPRPERTLSSVRPPSSTSSSSSSSSPPPPSSSPSSSTSSSSSSKGGGEATPASVISLRAPRPQPHRTQNLYVDAPLSTPIFSLSQHKSEIFKQQQQQKQTNLVVCVQPSSSSSVINKSRITSPLSDLVSNKPFQSSSCPPRRQTQEEESIICRECGRCRCQACRTPKKLPRRWMCSGKWLCSPEKVVDTVSCYCCVRGAFYHCQKDYLSEESVDKPCSCSPDGSCLLRWSCLSALSLFMPCLWCYLPLEGCVKLSEYVYGRVTVNGCQCEALRSEESSPKNTPSDPWSNGERILMIKEDN